MLLSVSARESALSRVQVKEVLEELKQFHPHVEFNCTYISTRGDRDLATSLRSLDKTDDFFTRDLDERLLNGCSSAIPPLQGWVSRAINSIGRRRAPDLSRRRISSFFKEEFFNAETRVTLHSAKDLPDPLRKGLIIVALTKGVDPSDVIILREDNPRRVGSSSPRRDEAVKKLFADAECVDIRGTIERRLQLLDDKVYDAVVMAEAALIRLKLTHRKRLKLPGPTAHLQGRLAVVAREDDEEMKQLFSCIHHETI